jgi:hypothetical protein
LLVANRPVTEFPRGCVGKVIDHFHFASHPHLYYQLLDEVFEADAPNRKVQPVQRLVTSGLEIIVGGGASIEVAVPGGVLVLLAVAR